MRAIVPRLNALALALYPRRSWFFLTTIACGVAAALDAWLAPHMPARVAFGVFGLLGLGLTWSWGMFLLCGWFGPETRIYPPFKIFAAIMLFLFLVVGSVGFVLFSVTVMLGGG